MITNKTVNITDSSNVIPVSIIPWKQLMNVLCPIIKPRKAIIPVISVAVIAKKTNGSTTDSSILPINISSFIV